MTSPGFVARLGLAITSPRWALTVAADRRHAGRSGSDLIVVIAIVLLATQVRGLFAAAWLGAVIGPGLGVRAGTHVVTQTLTVKLGFLVVAAIIVWLLAGSRRNLGRAFDVACVAALPLLFVELAATVIVRMLELELPRIAGVELAGVSFAWAGALIALGWRPARLATAVVPAPPIEIVTRARRAGWGVLALCLVGVAVGAVSVARHLEDMRPMTSGDPAPTFALPSVGARGALGAPFALSTTRGKVTVIDFWATWCKPCLHAMPALDAIAKAHPDVVVLAINLDDPADARALFDERGYQMTLLADDGAVSQRYGVTSIPHSVVIDRAGVVRLVARGEATDLAALVDQLRREQIRDE